MQKWEYTRITFLVVGYGTNNKVKGVSYGESNEFLEYRTEHEILNGYGAKGWELVCVEPRAALQGNTIAHIYHFKRPVEG